MTLPKGLMCCVSPHIAKACGGHGGAGDAKEEGDAEDADGAEDAEGADNRGCVA